jgi:diguanylate cyclase (GGDEF)-like protein
MALDTVADMLRACAEHAFDTHQHTADAIREQAERWARHLLLGAPHPSVPGKDGRDFVGVRRFVREMRASEGNFVRHAQRDFRSLISSVFANFERALLKDTQSDQDMKRQLARLRGSVQSASLEELRREVTSVSLELSSMITTREERRTEEVAALGTELRSLNQRLEETRRTAETDALTGVHNRHAFDAFIERVVEFDGMTGTPAALLMLDVDNFKILNDRHGHPAGDAALSGVGAALARAFLRKCDFVARYGGEEFAVVVRDANNSEARRLAERARAAIEAMRLPEPLEQGVTASVGVAILGDRDTGSTWLKRADDAMYEAKRMGKNCCCVAR